MGYFLIMQTYNFLSVQMKGMAFAKDNANYCVENQAMNVESNMRVVTKWDIHANDRLSYIKIVNVIIL